MEQFKRAQVIMLPTNDISNLCLGNNLSYVEAKNGKTLSQIWEYLKQNFPYKPQHLYIISDDKIKKGDWYINLKYNTIIQKKDALPLKDNCKKIIATTDTSLLNTIYTPHISGEISKRMRDLLKLPQPSQQFIEKYIESYNKGEVITDVLVEYEKSTYEDWIKTAEAQPEYKLKVNPKDNTITIKIIIILVI